MVNRIFLAILMSTLSFTASAQDDSKTADSSGHTSHTSGAACDKARTKIAEDFLKKNYEVFGLKEDRKLLEVKEEAPVTGSVAAESNIVASFEQKSGSIIETVELRLQGQKNFECEDFRTDRAEVEVTNFRVE